MDPDQTQEETTERPPTPEDPNDYDERQEQAEERGWA